MKLKSGLTFLTVTVLLTAGTACSKSSDSPTDTEALMSSVRTPLMSDPPPLDPDVFYQPEGLL
ncbi:MAG: peptide/nickel transport system substrate-binding protein, partial [Mycobacterium sp.]|nr:peptide/nickel transport system substrate-binding protein [Mycobacterium sp.]